jgi:valyl-tRNA synthetase
MDKYEYSMASTYLYNFVYDDFCSNYLEMSKVALQSDDEKYKQVVKSLLVNILKNIIIMIYPFAPFIGEELYLALPEHKKSIMLESFPKAKKCEESGLEDVKELYKIIQDVRNYKVSNKLVPNYKLNLVIEYKNKPFEGYESYLKRFTFAEKITLTEKSSSSGMKFVYNNSTLFIEDSISAEELAAKKEKDIAFLKSEIARCEGMLSNKNFVEKAPKEKVELERQKLETLKARLKIL